VHTLHSVWRKRAGRIMEKFRGDHGIGRRQTFTEVSLKGQCHEMNNFFEGPKNQISTFCIKADGF
jgi:hypothetical protein